jgi:hypothetical protein
MGWRGIWNHDSGREIRIWIRLKKWIWLGPLYMMRLVSVYTTLVRVMSDGERVRENGREGIGIDCRTLTSLRRECDLVSMVVRFTLTTNLLNPLGDRSIGLTPQAREQRQTSIPKASRALSHRRQAYSTTTVLFDTCSCPARIPHLYLSNSLSYSSSFSPISQFLFIHTFTFRHNASCSKHQHQHQTRLC